MSHRIINRNMSVSVEIKKIMDALGPIEAIGDGIKGTYI